MPTYEYECDACGHAFEAFHSMTEKPIAKCPSCGKKKVRRLMGRGGAVIFKGSGFYITDYRSKEYNSSKAKAEGASSASTPAPAKKTDAPKGD